MSKHNLLLLIKQAKADTHLEQQLSKIADLADSVTKLESEHPYAHMAASMVPGLGSAVNLTDAGVAARQGRPLAVVGNATLAGLGALPFLGQGAEAAGAGVKALASPTMWSRLLGLARKPLAQMAAYPAAQALVMSQPPPPPRQETTYPYYANKAASWVDKYEEFKSHHPGAFMGAQFSPLLLGMLGLPNAAALAGMGTALPEAASHFARGRPGSGAVQLGFAGMNALPIPFLSGLPGRWGQAGRAINYPLQAITTARQHIPHNLNFALQAVVLPAIAQELDANANREAAPVYANKAASRRVILNNKLSNSISDVLTKKALTGQVLGKARAAVPVGDRTGAYYSPNLAGYKPPHYQGTAPYSLNNDVASNLARQGSTLPQVTPAATPHANAVMNRITQENQHGLPALTANPQVQPAAPADNSYYDELQWRKTHAHPLQHVGVITPSPRFPVSTSMYPDSRQPYNPQVNPPSYNITEPGVPAHVATPPPAAPAVTPSIPSQTPTTPDQNFSYLLGRMGHQQPTSSPDMMPPAVTEAPAVTPPAPTPAPVTPTEPTNDSGWAGAAASVQPLAPPTTTPTPPPADAYNAYTRSMYNIPDWRNQPRNLLDLPDGRNGAATSQEQLLPDWYKQPQLFDKTSSITKRALYNYLTKQAQPLPNIKAPPYSQDHSGPLPNIKALPYSQNHSGPQLPTPLQPPPNPLTSLGRQLGSRFGKLFTQPQQPTTNYQKSSAVVPPPIGPSTLQLLKSYGIIGAAVAAPTYAGYKGYQVTHKKEKPAVDVDEKKRLLKDYLAMQQLYNK